MSHCITQLIFLGSITQWKRITYNGYMYPDWAQAVAWLLALSSFLAIPTFALYSIFHPKGSFREVWKIYCRIKWHCRISTWHLKKSRLQIKRSWLNLDWIIVYCCHWVLFIWGYWLGDGQETLMTREEWLQLKNPIRGKEKYSNVFHNAEI